MVFLPLLILPTKYSKYSYLGSQLSIFQNCMLWKFKFSLTLNYKYVYVVYMICIIHIYFMDCFFFFQIESDDFYQRLKKLEHCAKCNMYYQGCDKFILLDSLHTVHQDSDP